MLQRVLSHATRALPFALLALGLAVTAANAAPLALGTAMPAASESLRGTDGKTHTLAAAKGEKGTLVVFTCNHCPYVKAWEARITAIGNEYAKKGISVVAINSNDPEKKPADNMDAMKVRAKELGLAFPYVADAGAKVARAFGAERTPEVFLFDATGKLVYHGAVDDNAEKPDEVKEHFLTDALQAVLAGREVVKGETKAIGCSIKF